MGNKRSLGSAHSVSGLFVFLLIGVFALFSVTLVLTGVRVYRNVTEAAAHNTDYQLALSYLKNKVHTYDHTGGVRVDEENGRQILCLSETIEGEAYETRIFQEGDTIFEQFTAAGDAFDPELGEALTQVKAMRFTVTTPNLLQMDVTLPDGSEHTLHMALRSSQVR